jgi:DNA invertase Pin-like site-specific DNA recombinase
MTYGYARVSTEDQAEHMQVSALLNVGCLKVFTDRLSGATADRPALKRCLKTLREGDTLVVWKLDRLTRSLKDLIAMLDELRARGVHFRSLTEAIDTETPAGRAMWQMIGVFAEMERSFISERTKAGVKAARKRGVRFGRKRILTGKQLTHAQKLFRGGTPLGEISEILKVHRSTLYRRLQK